LFLVKKPDFSGAYVTETTSVLAVVVADGGTQKVSTFAVGWFIVFGNRTGPEPVCVCDVAYFHYSRPFARA
jgi:hypothetical protein